MCVVMAIPALALEPLSSVFERPDWRAVGLVMSILGSFLLANAILFRHPRKMVEELFSGEKRELRPIREYIFHRVQVSLGFLYLLAGFCFQLYGLNGPVEEPGAAVEFPPRRIPTYSDTKAVPPASSSFAGPTNDGADTGAAESTPEKGSPPEERVRVR